MIQVKRPRRIYLSLPDISSYYDNSFASERPDFISFRNDHSEVREKQSDLETLIRREELQGGSEVECRGARRSPSRPWRWTDRARGAPPPEHVWSVALSHVCVRHVFSLVVSLFSPPIILSELISVLDDFCRLAASDLGRGLGASRTCVCARHRTSDADSRPWSQPGE